MEENKRGYLRFLAGFVALVGGVVLLSTTLGNSGESQIEMPTESNDPAAEPANKMLLEMQAFESRMRASGEERNLPSSNATNVPTAQNSVLLEEFIRVNGRTRRFLIFVPEIYFDEDVEVPLIFTFHGFTNTPEIAQRDFALDVIAETENFINVYPAGLGNNWEVTTMDGDNDLPFVLAMLDYMQNEFKIKESAIYTTGYSHGGFFSNIVACNFADIFAANAPMAGTFYFNLANDCNPSRPVPQLEMHGTFDFVIPLDGGFFTISVDDALERWAEINGQRNTPVVVQNDPSRGTEHYIFQPDSTVQHYRVSGASHGAINNFPSEEIIDFFKEVSDF